MKKIRPIGFFNFLSFEQIFSHCKLAEKTENFTLNKLLWAKYPKNQELIPIAADYETSELYELGYALYLAAFI